MNFLNETLHKLKDLKLTSSDIEFIGSADGKYSCSWQEFEKMADQEYLPSYYCQEVAIDLIIRFKTGATLRRVSPKEYDGIERWEVAAPLDVNRSAKIKFIIRKRRYWQTVEQMQEDE